AINNGQVPLDYLVTLITFSNVSSLITIIPLVMFLAIILTLSRLYSLSEIVAMNSCGFGPSSYYKGLMPFMLFVLIIEFALVIWINPKANNYIEQIKQVVANKMSIDLIEGGKFNLFSGDKQVIYVDEIKDNKNLKRIFIRLQSKNEQYIITANKGFVKEAYDDGSRYLVLIDGFRYDVILGKEDFKKVSFSQYGILINPKAWRTTKKDEDSEAFMTLWKQRSKPVIQAEFQWRISMILSIFVLFMVAIPLSKIEPRKGPYSKVLPSVILYFLYYSLLKASVDWISNESIPFWLGLWWVHISYLIGSIILYRYQYGQLKLIKKLKPV
ncbi:MAG: LPS export ABC transporter permease LptF, partial [Gammaproteobacteria bacterium]|nr:LPS export ABC transporter permease LptF [Gammaproteobacteria bacterium]